MTIIIASSLITTTPYIVKADTRGKTQNQTTNMIVFGKYLYEDQRKADLEEAIITLGRNYQGDILDVFSYTATQYMKAEKS